MNRPESHLEAPLVYVVDDDPVVRETLVRLVKSVDLAVRPCDSALQFLEIYESERPGCVVADICMPGMNGLELQDELLKRRLDIPIILLTGHADVPMAVRGMSQGAVGFLEKPYRSHEVLKLVKKAIEKDAEQRNQNARLIEIEQQLEQLSPRERQVLDLVVEGNANKVIASRLKISQRTVEIHRAKVMDKMDAESLAKLVEMMVYYRSLRKDEKGSE